MKITKIFIFLLVGSLFGCSDYLDVVPDNIPTIEHAFKDRTNALKYLATCYNYMPNLGNQYNDPSLLGSDEWWAVEDSYYGTWHGLRLKLGRQNSNSPLMNFWDGGNGGSGLFKAIRDCNIFLENIHKVGPDLEDEERERWIGEVKFLKAFYHYYLLRAYGPIPIQRETLPVFSKPEVSHVEREHFDDCVAYVTELLDEAIQVLPIKILNKAVDLGHITKPAAMALKADVLLTAASPLFNGNSDFEDLTNSLGDHLFDEYQQSKWDSAAVACRAAIETALEAGHKFYEFDEYAEISDTTQLLMNLKQVVSERWNDEIVWTMSNLSMSSYYKSATPYFQKKQMQWVPYDPYMCPTLRMVESFYSANGVPIDEDNTYDYAHRYQVGAVPSDHIYYAKPGYQTMNLNLHREPRFYANIAFDGGVWFGNGRYKEIGKGSSNETSWIFKMKSGQENGRNASFRFSVSGYWAKKPSHIENSSPDKDSHVTERSTFPVFRLADLYLMYAEALNESLSTPNQDVWNAIDVVRNRAGLEGVVDSWTNYSIYPDKVYTKDGMREIIRKERTNELAFEGKRFWDLRRWKTAHIHMNQPIQGLNANGSSLEEFNQVRTLSVISFTSREYLWPISIGNIRVNPKLTQNPGW